ncbi:MAG: ATP-dependent DNA helicase RecG, partial [Methyloligellaceae bacterium]
MRPNALTPYFAGLRGLEGIGPRLETLLARLLRATGEETGPRVVDLLFHLPTGLIDRRARPTIAEAVPGQLATLDVTVARHAAPPGRASRVPYRVTCEDATGTIELVFFHADKSYLERLLPLGERRFVSGRVDDFSGRLQMPHPDYVVSADEFDTLPLVEPVYPLTAGLSGKVLQKALAQALDRAEALPEWQEPHWLARQSWAGFTDALGVAHRPESEADLGHDAPARQRLAFDELLANQLALALV